MSHTQSHIPANCKTSATIWISPSHHHVTVLNPAEYPVHSHNISVFHYTSKEELLLTFSSLISYHCMQSSAVIIHSNALCVLCPNISLTFVFRLTWPAAKWSVRSSMIAGERWCCSCRQSGSQTPCGWTWWNWPTSISSQVFWNRWESSHECYYDSIAQDSSLKVKLHKRY